MLSDGESRSISQLASGRALSRQAITKHLRVLESAGLVQNERVGRESHFAFRPQPLRDATTFLAQTSQRWDAALDRLKRFVEA